MVPGGAAPSAGAGTSRRVGAALVKTVREIRASESENFMTKMMKIVRVSRKAQMR
jgi:hypothetical protein